LIEIAAEYDDGASLDIIPKMGPRAGTEIAVHKRSMMTLLTAGLTRNSPLALRTRGEEATKLMAKARAFVEGRTIDTSSPTPACKTAPSRSRDLFEGKDVVRETIRTREVPDFEHGQVVRGLLEIARHFQMNHDTELYTQLPNGEPAKIYTDSLDCDGLFYIVKVHVYEPDSRLIIIGEGPKATEAVTMIRNHLGTNHGGDGSGESGDGPGGAAGAGSEGGMAPPSDGGFSAAEMQGVDITPQLLASALQLNAAAAML